MLKKQMPIVLLAMSSLIISGCSGSKSKSAAGALRDATIPQDLPFDSSQVSKVHLNDQDRALGLSLMKSMSTMTLNGGSVSNTDSLSNEQKNIIDSLKQKCESKDVVSSNIGNDSSIVVGKTYPITGNVSLGGADCPVSWSAAIHGDMTLLSKTDHSAAVYLEIGSDFKQILLTPDAQQAFSSTKSEGNLSMQVKEEISNSGVRVFMQFDAKMNNEILPSGIGGSSEALSNEIHSKLLASGGTLNNSMKMQFIVTMNLTHKGKSFPLTIYVNSDANSFEPQMRAFLGDSELTGDDLKIVKNLPLMGADQLNFLNSLDN
ncbi:MAG: hypothetical protein H6623_07835 [Bdellovibrionaceae bacterium]|nr:hypothetical protein [Pseudobdellovibrionaceae bacterium]